MHARLLGSSVAISVAAACAALPLARSAEPAKEAPGPGLVAVSEWSCDLKSGQTKGSGPLAVLSRTDRDKDGLLELVLKVDVSGHAGLRVLATYAAAPTGGWTLDVGDSATNDGGAGDAATQSHDAEVDIKDGVLSVYGDDQTPRGASRDGCKLLAQEKGVGGAGERVAIVALDGETRWGPAGGLLTTLRSPHLFALRGQPDTEGPVNRELFVGVNRMIGRAGRSGNGLTSVVVEVLDAAE